MGEAALAPNIDTENQSDDFELMSPENFEMPIDAQREVMRSAENDAEQPETSPVSTNEAGEETEEVDPVAERLAAAKGGNAKQWKQTEVFENALEVVGEDLITQKGDSFRKMMESSSDPEDLLANQQMWRQWREGGDRVFLNKEMVTREGGWEITRASSMTLSEDGKSVSTHLWERAIRIEEEEESNVDTSARAPETLATRSPESTPETPDGEVAAGTVTHLEHAAAATIDILNTSEIEKTSAHIVSAETETADEEPQEFVAGEAARDQAHAQLLKDVLQENLPTAADLDEEETIVLRAPAPATPTMEISPIQIRDLVGLKNVETVPPVQPLAEKPSAIRMEPHARAATSERIEAADDFIAEREVEAPVQKVAPTIEPSAPQARAMDRLPSISTAEIEARNVPIKAPESAKMILAQEPEIIAESPARIEADTPAVRQDVLPVREAPISIAERAVMGTLERVAPAVTSERARVGSLVEQPKESTLAVEEEARDEASKIVNKQPEAEKSEPEAEKEGSKKEKEEEFLGRRSRRGFIFAPTLSKAHNDNESDDAGGTMRSSEEDASVATFKRFTAENPRAIEEQVEDTPRVPVAEMKAVQPEDTVLQTIEHSEEARVDTAIVATPVVLESAPRQVDTPDERANPIPFSQFPSLERAARSSVEENAVLNSILPRSVLAPENMRASNENLQSVPTRRPYVVDIADAPRTVTIQRNGLRMTTLIPTATKLAA